MKIEESFGVVSKEGKQWDDLCDCIADYVYDMKDGLNCNPILDDEERIYMSNITSYYKYKYGFIKNIIPNWIGDFELIFINGIKSKGTFNRGTAELKDGKLYFTILIKNYMDLTVDKFIESLAHEFRHAYKVWVEKVKGININSTNKDAIYAISQASFKNKVAMPLVDKYNNGNIEINSNIYYDESVLSQYILRSLYYTDTDEINSFLLEFRAWVINKYVKLKLKIDFNNLIDNEIPYYECEYYTIYASYLNFWENIEDTPTQIADKVVMQLNDVLIKCLYNNELVVLSKGRTSLQVLKKLAKKQKRSLNETLESMEKIYKMIVKK